MTNRALYQLAKSTLIRINDTKLTNDCELTFRSLRLKKANVMIRHDHRFIKPCIECKTNTYFYYLTKHVKVAYCGCIPKNKSEARS